MEFNGIPSREVIYPTLGKGNIIFKKCLLRPGTNDPEIRVAPKFILTDEGLINGSIWIPFQDMLQLNFLK